MFSQFRDCQSPKAIKTIAAVKMAHNIHHNDLTHKKTPRSIFFPSSISRDDFPLFFSGE